MTLEFEHYVARVASTASAGNAGFQSEQERDLLKEAVLLLRDISVWWRDLLGGQGKHLSVTLDENSPATDGAKALAAVGSSFSIVISVEFLHNLVSKSIGNVASLPEYDVGRSILSATALIFFHELAHVLFGHTEVVRPGQNDYRVDETSADFRSGMLFVKTAVEHNPFRLRLDLRQPDEISRYAQIGALVLHRYLHECGTASGHYHKANNRFSLVCAGYLYMAAANRVSEPHRLERISKALERAVEESHDSGWKHVLRQDISDNWQLLTKTGPNYHTRADDYDNQSSVAGAILRSIKSSDGLTSQAVKRVRRFFGSEPTVSGVPDTNALREAESRIIIATKPMRSELDLNTLDALLLVVEFGRRGDLTDGEANEAAEFITRVGQGRPKLLMALSIAGFDGDVPRLTDIPACAQHFRRLFKALKELDSARGEPAVLEQFESQSRMLLRIAMGHAPRSALDIRPANDVQLLEQLLTDLERMRER